MADKTIPGPVEKPEIEPNDRAGLESLIDEVVPEPQEQPEVDIQPPEPEKDDKTPTAKPEEAGEADKEPVETPEKDEKPPEPAKIQSEEELEQELEKIQPAPNAHDNVKKGLTVLKTKVKDTTALLRSKAEEADRLAKELEASKTKPIPEDVQKRIEELETFRRIKDIESDPVFREKYDLPIKKINDDILASLESWQLPPKVKQFIDNNGGVAEVRYSTALMPDGKTTRAQWFRNEILDNLEDFQKEEIEDSLKEVRRLAKAKQADIEKAKADGEAWEQERTVAQQRQQEELEERANRVRDEVVAKMGVMAQRWEPKPDATPEEREYAAWHNEQLDKSAKTYAEMVGRHEPEIEVPKALAAAQATYLGALAERQQKTISDLQAKLNAANETIEKIKSSGRTAKQSNAPSNPKPAAPSMFGDEHSQFEKIMSDVLSKQS